jgi:hypothetical protein
VGGGDGSDDGQSDAVAAAAAGAGGVESLEGLEELVDLRWGDHRAAVAYAQRGLPALDGSYDEVAAYLDRYLALGVTKLLLTKVDSEEEFGHTREVLSRLIDQARDVVRP